MPYCVKYLNLWTAEFVFCVCNLSIDLIALFKHVVNHRWRYLWTLTNIFTVFTYTYLSDPHNSVGKFYSINVQISEFRIKFRRIDIFSFSENVSQNNTFMRLYKYINSCWHFYDTHIQNPLPLESKGKEAKKEKYRSSEI